MALLVKLSERAEPPPPPAAAAGPGAPSTIFRRRLVLGGCYQPSIGAANRHNRRGRGRRLRAAGTGRPLGSGSGAGGGRAAASQSRGAGRRGAEAAPGSAGPRTRPPRVSLQSSCKLNINNTDK